MERSRKDGRDRSRELGKTSTGESPRPVLGQVNLYKDVGVVEGPIPYCKFRTLESREIELKGWRDR